MVVVVQACISGAVHFEPKTQTELSGLGFGCFIANESRR